MELKFKNETVDLQSATTGDRAFFVALLDPATTIAVAEESVAPGDPSWYAFWHCGDIFWHGCSLQATPQEALTSLEAVLHYAEKHGAL